MIIFFMAVLIQATIAISYQSKQQIFLKKNEIQVLNFQFKNNFKYEKIISTFHIENNWLTTSLPFDIIITPEKLNAGCIEKDLNSCVLTSQNITSYTYVKNRTLNFTDMLSVNTKDETKKESNLYVFIVNNQKFSPKALVGDLTLDTTFSIEIKKEGTVFRIGLLVGIIGMFLLSGILYIKVKNMSNEVKIYDKVLEELEIQMNQPETEQLKG